MGSSRLAFVLLLTAVIVCIALDELARVWIEWGELGVTIKEKLRLTVSRAFSGHSS
jgi:hypothetical protein